MRQAEEILEGALRQRQREADTYSAWAREGIEPLTLSKAQEACRRLDAAIWEAAARIEDALGTQSSAKRQRVRQCRRGIRQQLERLEKGLALNSGSRMRDDLNLVLTHITPEEERSLRGETDHAIRLIRSEEDFRRLLRAALESVEYEADVVHARDAAVLFADPERYPTQGLKAIASRMQAALTSCRMPREMEPMLERLDEVRYNFIRLGTAAECRQHPMLNLLSRAYRKDLRDMGEGFMDYAAHDREAVCAAIAERLPQEEIIGGLRRYSPECAGQEIFGRRGYPERLALPLLRAAGAKRIRVSRPDIQAR